MATVKPGNRALTEPTPASATILSAGQRTIDVERDGLAALREAMNGDLGAAFESVVALIRAARGRVVVTGIGKSGHISRKIASTMASTGTPAMFVHPGEASHGDLGMITADDIVVALSWSGEASELASVIHYSRRFRVPLIAITANAESTLGRASDIVLQLPAITEACPHGLAPTTSAVLQLAIGDAIAIALLESRGFTAQDFRLYHPGGKLGASLRLVREVMHTGDEVPLVPMGTAMAAAIAEISDKRLGCVGVIDADGLLTGIITDGDIRRRLGDGFLQRPVETVMTRSPKTTRPDALLASAIETVNAAGITALFVTVDGRPVGLVHLHALLRAGVA